MARPRKYANDAEKQAAYRARYAVVEARLKPETLQTLDDIAAEFDVPRTEVINSLIQFALTNRNWKTQGLWGKRLPYSKNPIGKGDDMATKPSKAQLAARAKFAARAKAGTLRKNPVKAGFAKGSTEKNHVFTYEVHRWSSGAGEWARIAGFFYAEDAIAYAKAMSKENPGWTLRAVDNYGR